MIKYFKLLPFLLFPVSLIAQKVSVNTIEDSRSTGDGYFSNRCKVEFRITGEESRKYMFAKLLSIDKAVDDRGNDLFREPDSFGYEYKEKEDTYFKIEADLLNPSRKAETITELNGKMRLFKPTLENGGIVQVKDFISKAGKNLISTKFPFKIMYMSKEEVMKYNSDNDAKKEEALSKLSPEMAAGMRELIGAFSGLFGNTDDNNSLYFMVDGEADKLVTMRFLDENGEELSNSGYSKSGNTTNYYMQEMAKPGWTVEFQIETEAAVKDISFSLKNIELP